MLLRYLQTSNPGKVFVLVHSAFYGAWCWRKVTPLLQSKGHTVFTPDLPGHGQNTGIAFENIRLNTYVKSLTDLILRINHGLNKKVILVGHGAATATISQVAENVPNSIAKLVFLCGFVLRDGESLMQEKQQMISPGVLQETFIDRDNAQIMLPLSPRVIQLFLQDCNPDQVLFALSRMQKQPLYPLMDPLTLSDAGFGSIPKIYIQCLQNNAISIADQRRMCDKIEWEQIIQCHAGHSSFLSKPEILSKLLDEYCCTAHTTQKKPTEDELQNTRKSLTI